MLGAEGSSLVSEGSSDMSAPCMELSGCLPSSSSSTSLDCGASYLGDGIPTGFKTCRAGPGAEDRKAMGCRSDAGNKAHNEDYAHTFSVCSSPKREATNVLVILDGNGGWQ